jgi:AcrR family transcriptional regulator
MFHIKEDKRAVQSANLIYNALSEIMNEKEYESISVTELVNKAGVGRATFYRGFDQIDDVLKWKCELRFKELYLYVREYYSNPTYFELSFFILPFLKFWNDDDEIVRTLIKGHRLDIFRECFYRLFQHFAKELPSDDNVINQHLDYFIAARAGISMHLLITWINKGKDVTPEELNKIIIEQTKYMIEKPIFSPQKKDR